MAHVVFTSQRAADDFSAAVDADFGYPIPNVVSPGGVSAQVGQTTRFAATLKHPNRNQWAYPDEPVIKGKRGRVPLPGGATVETLDATWDGAEPNRADGKVAPAAIPNNR